MPAVQEYSRQGSVTSFVSSIKGRGRQGNATVASVDMAKADNLAEKLKEKERMKRRDKNLSLDIKNYQRKTMLNGIDQQETLDANYGVVQAAVAQGVSPMVVSNFKGKEILDSLRELKVQYDRDYFNRQTYKEFLVDPLGAKLIDAWAVTDKAMQANAKDKTRLNLAISKIAKESSLSIDIDAPSKKR